MQNAPSINLKKFECRLVNSFGDGHNHELAQYESFAASMQRIAASKGIDGILLGNVVCDNVSLDALLLTSFGVFIIEFKNYKGVDRIRITGQKEFQCLKSNGERMTLIDGSFLNVKGGSLASPYEQAKKNRIAVCNTLKRVFGDGTARKIHVGVAIVFNGQMAIEGIDRIIESERRWLTVVDSKGFEQFMSYVADEHTVGLDASERETMIRHMDANGCVLEKANVFQQSQEFYKLGKYIEAYEKAVLCDPLNPDVVVLKLASLYNIRDNKKYSRLFNELCVEHLNSAHPMVREAANKFMGLSFFIGRHGNHGENTVYDGKKDCYLIAIPDMTRDLKDRMESSIVVMCREGVVFSANCTVLISILIAVKPFLYTLFSILF
ncbi:MAG: NERD domain-containing protein [Muribaculaceae bacterium]|nr:NERD domain-containing protein [Muribaculaceae bacterium]